MKIYSIGYMAINRTCAILLLWRVCNNVTCKGLDKNYYAGTLGSDLPQEFQALQPASGMGGD